ncbi:hypothetical protein QTP70_032902 [Hemibagrus guttatus]|uniref:Uncharacterized protein n=1 Tax=Hemibagrus guttatus TaxID=175788 RepID=A0AAE0PQK3_9TELE|nr:hypothetical protein QTP70_032902 [Hemibagrus guttatus]
MTVSLAEAEEKHQKDVETITQLEEKSNLTDQVKTLQDTVEDLGSQLCDAHLQCDELKNEYEQEQEAHRLLKSEYEEMIETLKNSEKFLKGKLSHYVSLAEAEEKYQDAWKTIVEQEHRKFILIDKIQILKDHVDELEDVQAEDFNQLVKVHKILQAEHKETEEKLKHCEKLLMEYEQEQEAHRLLKSEYEEMMETLKNSEKFLKVIYLLRSIHDCGDTHNVLQVEQKETEEKLKRCEKLLMVQELESHSTLKMEKDKLKTLTPIQEFLKEYEQEQEAHRLLKSEYEEMIETLKNSEKLLKVSLAEAKEKHQKDVDTIAELEKKKFNLINQEYTGLKDTHNVLQVEQKETEEKLKRCEELLMEYEQEQEAHRLLKSEYKEMMETLKNSEKFLKVSLAEAKEKHQKDVDTIAQLEKKKFNLINQAHYRLRDTHKILQAEQKETEKKLKHCEKLLMEYVQEQEAHRLLKSEYEEMIETLKNSENFTEGNLSYASVAEAEEKHQKAMMTFSQLMEKSLLINQVKTLKDTVEEREEVKAELHEDCDEIMDEYSPLGGHS